MQYNDRMSATQQHLIQRVRGHQVESVHDVVALEEPLEIRLGYDSAAGRAQRSVSITMRTPGHDDELAAGFLFSEGIVTAPEQIASIAPCGPPVPGKNLHNVVRVELAGGAVVDLKRLERHFYTTSSCGVCGKTSIEALRTHTAYTQAILASAFAISDEALLGLPAQLATRQKIFDQTGGLHASGLFDSNGAVTLVREDVGRHNALDKLLGRLFLDGQLPATEHGVIVSGRTSFELMQKGAMAGVPMLAAVGAPSSLAVEMADEFGMALVGFLRDRHFNIYAGAKRVVVGSMEKM